MRIAKHFDYVGAANLARIQSAFELINELSDALEELEKSLAKTSTNKSYVERDIDRALFDAAEGLNRLRTTECKIQLEKDAIADFRRMEEEKAAAENDYDSFPKIVKEVAEITGQVGEPRKKIKKPTFDVLEQVVHVRLAKQNDQIRAKYLDDRDELLNHLKSATKPEQRADAISRIDACELEYSKQYKRFIQGWAEDAEFKAVEEDIEKAWPPKKKKKSKISTSSKHKKQHQKHHHRKNSYQWRDFSDAEKKRKKRQQKSFSHFRSISLSSVPSRTHSHRSGRVFVTGGRMNPRAIR